MTRKISNRRFTLLGLCQLGLNLAILGYGGLWGVAAFELVSRPSVIHAVEFTAHGILLGIVLSKATKSKRRSTGDQR